MAKVDEHRRTYLNFDLDYYISRQIELFLIDRKSSGLAKSTIDYYIQKLGQFENFCSDQLVNSVLEVDPGLIRSYLLYLEEKGNNKGGVHAQYRAIKAFLNWFESEAEPEGWKNPIKKVKAPKVPNQILNPVENDVVNAMIDTCNSDDIFDLRDRAIFLVLYDTGCRASELVSLDISDIDSDGTVFIKAGKGGKDRFGFLGKKTRSAIRKYLNKRNDDHPALFLAWLGERLGYDGLRNVFDKRAELAHVERPSPHMFRRAYALNLLRAGIDVYTISKLMGHSSLEVLKRYLKIDETDLRTAHKKSGPVDNIL